MTWSIPPGARAFTVELARTGRHCNVAADETIVQALERIGVVVQTSCQEGICGTCLTTVIEGALEHHDQVLSDSERAAGDVMCLCVSRATSPRLVLDL
ncbi:MAG: 2Fe-2S iron-sulfur cluster-binding protein [Lautropia sp.]